MSVLSDLGASNSVIPTTLFSSLADTVYVNSFYDGTHATGPTGASRPLSTWYGTLGAAQAVYTSATALTDEVDWCAWQAAADYVYTRQATGSWPTGDNLSSGHLLASGRYIVNKTITINAAGIEIEGVDPRGGLGTAVTYNGAGGTIDAPVPIFDIYNYDEFNYANGRTVSTSTGGAFVRIENMMFIGKYGDMRSASQNVSAYVQGVRLRAFSGARITDCDFEGTLYDGIVGTAPSLFIIIEQCRFYGVHRDGIAFQGFAGNFTTLIRLLYNDFGFVGRYAILMDLTGATTPTCLVDNNTFEHAFSDSYYLLNREWFVQAVTAGCCFIGCGNLVFRDNYWEGVVDPTTCEAAVHLVECSPVTLMDDNLEHLYVTSTDSLQGTTDAGKTWRDGQGGAIAVTTVTNAATAHVSATSHGYSNNTLVRFYISSGSNAMSQLLGPTFMVKNVSADAFDLYDSTGVTPTDSSGWGVFSGVNTKVTTGTRFLDITNARNYRCSYTGHQGSASRIIVRHAPSLAKIYVPDDYAFDGTTASLLEDCNVSLWRVQTKIASGNEGHVVTALSVDGAATYVSTPTKFQLRNASADSRNYSHYDTTTQSGDFQCTTTASGWTIGTAYYATFTSNYLFSVRQLVVPADAHWNGYVFQCMYPGTSGGAEPTWLPGVPTETTITNITKANPAVVTANGHGFANGDHVYIQGVVGMTEVNYRMFTVAGATASDFQLSSVNSLAYTAYTSAGRTFIVTNDNGIAWKCVAIGAYLSSENNRAEVMQFSQRIVQAYSNLAPTTGYWSQGDQVRYRIPDASDYVGQVCVASGVPGTWKKFGATTA